MGFLIKDEWFSDKKYFFFVQRVVIRMLGYWAGSDNISSWQIAFVIFNALEILGYGIFQINFCLQNIDDLVLLLNGLAPLVTQIVIVNKLAVYVWKRKDIKKVLDHLLDSFVNGQFLES